MSKFKKSFNCFKSFVIMAFVSSFLIGTAFGNSCYVQFQNSGNNISDSIVEAYFNKGNTKTIAIVQADSLIFQRNFADSSETIKHAAPLFERLIAISLFDIALYEGYIYSTNEPVRKYLPELPEKEFSTASLAQFFNLGMDDSKALNIPDGLFESKTPGNDAFGIITELCCLIVERATGTEINEYYECKFSRIDSEINDSNSLNGLQAGSSILQSLFFTMSPQHWHKITWGFLLDGMQDTLSVENGNDFLFLSIPKNLFILWIGTETPDLEIYDFVKKLSEPG